MNKTTKDQSILNTNLKTAQIRIEHGKLVTKSTKKIHAIVSSSCKPQKSMNGIKSMKPTTYIKAAKKRAIF